MMRNPKGTFCIIGINVIMHTVISGEAILNEVLLT